jgi:threonylcarbamoyladenosine tRNA methylthiotransferase MtaB
VKVFLRTFGCRANHYDSERVRALVEGAGHAIVGSAAEADAAVFNSCAVTADAEADLRQAVRRAWRERPGLRAVVMGCAAALPAESSSGRALRELPGVEAVVAETDEHAVVAALGIAPARDAGVTGVAGLGGGMGVGPGATGATIQSGARALLRIQDGCDEHCTFCLTTLARGANRSRPVSDLVAEAGALAERHPEIVITGIHIGSYGIDIGSSLGALMETLVRDVPGVRFRLSSVEATEVDDRLTELLAAWGAGGSMVPHLHAPLQSGSDRLLRRMGRHWYTASTYAAAVERLAGRCPVLGLGADVITGFPGETDDDHRATMAQVESLPFTYLHVFPYSPRPGTAAERLRDRVTPTVAQARARQLREVAQRKAWAHQRARLGGVADVVVIRRATEGAGIGEALTEDYLTVLPGDASLPRRARFMARLSEEGGRIVAHPLG